LEDQSNTTKFEGGTQRRTACGVDKDIMDDDDYQRIADYENEIYDLNHEDQDQEQEVEGKNVMTEKEADQRSESITTSGSSGSSEFESSELSDESDSDDSAALSGSGKGKSPKSPSASSIHQPNTSLNVDVPDMSDEDSSGLSEDERDMIYSRLYHTNTALPFATEVPQDNEANSPSKKKTKKHTKSDTDDVPSSKFTFDLDLDNLSPPPEPTAPITETPTLASDDDEYPVSHPVVISNIFYRCQIEVATSPQLQSVLQWETSSVSAATNLVTSKPIVPLKRFVANAMPSTITPPSNVPLACTAPTVLKTDIRDYLVPLSLATIPLNHVGCAVIMAISRRHVTRSGDITDLSRLRI
jgi:hypothetical protein